MVYPGGLAVVAKCLSICDKVVEVCTIDGLLSSNFWLPFVSLQSEDACGSGVDPKLTLLALLSEDEDCEDEFTSSMFSDFVVVKCCTTGEFDIDILLSFALFLMSTVLSTFVDWTDSLLAEDISVVLLVAIGIVS